jgi:membrane protease YdiL (CAAX protease family)
MKEQKTAFLTHIFWNALIQALFAEITINAVAGFGEESRWRGFLLREFGHVGFWRP